VSAAAATEIVTSALGLRNIAVGAATLVLEAALDEPRSFPLTAAAR
jgi:hypothetical protein